MVYPVCIYMGVAAQICRHKSFEHFENIIKFPLAEKRVYGRARVCRNHFSVLNNPRNKNIAFVTRAIQYEKGKDILCVSVHARSFIRNSVNLTHTILCNACEPFRQVYRLFFSLCARHN